VDVLPEDPVSAITAGEPIRASTAWANLPSAATTSLTTTAGTPTGREASTQTAPAAIVSAAKSWPSACAPVTAANIPPGTTSRESLAVGPVTHAWESGTSDRVPLTAEAISASVMGITRNAPPRPVTRLA
jgi:hypothetical protein